MGTLKSFIKREKLTKEAVKNISFNIDEGELVGFLGPNGAGKTTTIKMLTGIIEPSKGLMSVMGYNPVLRQKALQQKFGLVMGQKNQLFKDLPAYESFILMGHIYDMEDSEIKEIIDELVGILGASEFLNVPMRSLSLGQRMKCELIGALIHRPKVLFLDEPTIGLDVVAQKGIRDFIKMVNKERGTTIMLTSHYMEDIQELCRRVIVIGRGEVRYDGPLTELVKKYADSKELEITFTGDGITEAEAAVYGRVGSYAPNKVTFLSKRDEAKALAAKLLASPLPVDDILINEMPIDDVVRRLFAEQN